MDPSPPSNRLLLLAAALLVLAGLPVLLAALALARVVLLPPVPNTRLISFDGLQVQGGCLDGLRNARGQRAWECKWDFHLDSRFEVLRRDPAAAAWCNDWVQASAARQLWSAQLGSATVGLFPPVWSGWDGCSYLIPLSVGFYAGFSINH